MTKPALYLRPYQATPAVAILQAAAAHDGQSYVLIMARQSGKNETSAWIEAMLLTRYAARPVTGIKAAPTAVPQAAISMQRLQDQLARLGLAHSGDGRFVRAGRARWGFLSAEKNSNVVGHTAHMLLECDEAQDVDPAKWSKEFRPMAASTSAPSVYYGTPWTDDDLLAQAAADARQQQRHDGHRRLFVVTWAEVAEHVPRYARYVLAERDRLGATHPLFLTQYEMQTVPGAGRLLSPAQLAAICASSHPRRTLPEDGVTYVAGLDVAGEDTAGTLQGRDSTVLTIGAVTWPDPKAPPVCDVVTAYEMTGTAHDALFGLLAGILDNTWRVRLVTVDETTLGEAFAHLLRRSLGEHRVRGIRFTQQSKSALGYGLQASATTGRFHLWRNDDTEEYRRAVHQLTRTRAEYLPNRAVRWYVPETDGHDDYTVSLALCNDAAENVRPPAVARGTRPGATIRKGS